LDASIIIPTFNRRAVLQRCLECLCEQDYPPDRFEVVVVDDGSDGTDEMVARMQPPYEMRYFRTDSPRGCGPAKNVGAAQARGEILIFLDDDAFAPPWYVRQHCESHRQAGRPAIVDGPAVYVVGEEALRRPPLQSLKVRLMAALDFFGAPFVNVNASCRRDAFFAVGGFDDTFVKPYGWEDIELGFRLLKSGAARIRNRRAYVLHYRGGSRPSLAAEAKIRHQFGIGAAMFYAKHQAEEVKRLTNWKSALAINNFLNRTGLTGRITLDAALRLEASGSILFPLYRKLLLTHVYAEGILQGLRDWNLAPGA